jgi:hypothetical protein
MSNRPDLAPSPDQAHRAASERLISPESSGARGTTMKQDVIFDYRISWQGPSPAEHGSRAELCFKARNGQETVICRVPYKVILNALRAYAAETDSLDIEDELGDRTEKRHCERLFSAHRPAFRALAQDKIRAEAFARSIGQVRSILIGEDELNRKVQELHRTH